MILAQEIPPLTSTSHIAQNEKGATMLEYGLLAALISVVAIAAITFLGEQTKVTKTNVSCNMCIANLGLAAFPDPVTFCAGAATTDPDALLAAMGAAGC